MKINGKEIQWTEAIQSWNRRKVSKLIHFTKITSTSMTFGGKIELVEVFDHMGRDLGYILRNDEKGAWRAYNAGRGFLREGTLEECRKVY